MSSKKEQNLVVLVDENNNEIGTEEKIEAHKKGLLHRAFSVFIANNENKILIHQRAKVKYHFGGLWSNSCCSHPKPDEAIEDAARRRVNEELGMSIDKLKKAFTETYKFKCEKSGLIEHEYNQIFTANCSKTIVNPDPNEIDDYRWVGKNELEKMVQSEPKLFTPWFKLFLPRFYEMFSTAKPHTFSSECE